MTIKVNITVDENLKDKIAEYILGSNPPVKLEAGKEVSVYIYEGTPVLIREVKDSTDI